MSLCCFSTRAVLAIAFVTSVCGVSPAASKSRAAVNVTLAIDPLQSGTSTLYATLSADGIGTLPNYVIDPAKVDVEVRRVDVPETSSSRLVPVDGSPVESGREGNLAGTRVTIHAAIRFKGYPAVMGATYEVTASARDAVSFPKDRAPIDDSSLAIPTYVFVRTSDATTSDPEVVKLQSAFATRLAVPSRPLRATCQGTDYSYEMPAGEAQHITGIDENFQPLTTGVGPSDDHTPGKIPDASNGRFESLAPIIVTVVPLSSRPDCGAATVAFASPREVSEYFEPATSRPDAAAELGFEANGTALFARVGQPSVGVHLDVREPADSPFTARSAFVHFDVRRIGSQTAPLRLTVSSPDIVKSKTAGFPDSMYAIASIAMKPFPVALASVYAIHGDARGAFTPPSSFAGLPMQFGTRYLATPSVAMVFGGRDQKDPEVRRFVKDYAGKPVVVRAPFGAYCTTGQPDGTLARGTVLKITDENRQFDAFVTGSGPTGDHTPMVQPAPGNDSFIALEPIEVAFSLARPSEACTAYIGMFSSYRDIARYLAPAP